MQETRKKRMVTHEPIDQIVEKQYKPRERKSAIKPKFLTVEEVTIEEEEGESVTEEPFVEPRKAVKKRRRKEILRKVCAIGVCKPEVCCADLWGKLSSRTTAQTFRRTGKAIYFFFFFLFLSFSASLGTSWTDKLMRSPLEAQRDPLIPCFLSCRGFT